MAKRIFVNNTNSYVGQAIFQQLRNDTEDNDDPNIIYGTYMEKDSSEKPKGIRKMLKRSKPKLKAKYIAECDILVYDLHETALGSQTVHDVMSGLEALKKHSGEEEKIVVIISSVMVWGNTPNKMILKDEKKIPAEEGEGQGEQKEEEASPPPPPPAQDSDEEKDTGEKSRDKTMEKIEQEPEKIWVPWEERDFTERVPVAGYDKMKELEDMVLEFKKENVKVYVICSGILYGLGETVFYEHLKSAWLQLPDSLPYIGFPPSIDKSVLEVKKKQASRPPTRDSIKSKPAGRRSQNMSTSSLAGKSPVVDLVPQVEEEPVITEDELRGSNLIPTIHIRDLARLVQKVVETKPEQQYLLALDCTQNREQKAQVEAISKGVGTGKFEALPENEKELQKMKLKVQLQNPHVRIFSDRIWREPLSLNLKMRPSSLLVGEDAPAGEEGGGEAESIFEWHAQGGICQNIGKMLEEFNKVRGLRPVRVLLNGPPCVGKSFYAAKLAEHYNVPIISRSLVTKIMEDENNELMKELAKIEEDFQLSNERWVQIIKMRLRQNDCKNRGFILDGVPECHTEALQVFMDFPKKKKPKPKKKAPKPEAEEGEAPEEGKEGEQNEDSKEGGEEAPEKAEEEEVPVEEEEAPEEVTKPKKPVLARDIIPESVVRFMGTSETLDKRAKQCKHNPKVFEERLQKYWKHNSIKNYRLPGREPPIERFFQLDNKTEILNQSVDGQLTSEVFESLRIYIERNERPYNYLQTMDELNERREKSLLKEEEEAINKQEKTYSDQRNKAKKQQEEREKAVERRVEDLEEHESELKEALSLGQREFLMKYIIPQLTEGMIEICKVVPIDPVDYLSEYMYRKSGEHRMPSQYRPTSSVGSVSSSL